MGDYSHAPTWDIDKDIDRIARWRGHRIGRIKLEPLGPESGKWKVHPQWYPPAQVNDADTLEDALTNIREAHQLAMTRAELEYYGG